MKLENDFTVPRPIGEAWSVLTDVERVAPCLPGAQLQEVEGDTYRGKVKVKVGPVLAQFAGEARFVELNEANHHAVLEAHGKESGGKGLASARIEADLTEQDGSTMVHVTTDLTVTGRLAQFGRGTLAEVSTRLLGQFTERLEQTLLSGETTPPITPGATVAGPEPTSTGEGVRMIEGPEAEPVDLLQSAGLPILKRVVPVLVVLIVAVAVVLRRRRSRRGR